MCTQINLEVVHERSKKEGRPPNFHEFRDGEVHCKKVLQKRKL
jgi:hypothetical protein